MALKKVLAICGSTRKDSVNLQFIKAVQILSADRLQFEIYEDIDKLPHFNPDLDREEPPAIVAGLREKITLSAAVLICTPEYVFSLPGSLKNCLEWTVSTTLFDKKPVAIITAAALGEKAHESLLLIMKTLGTNSPAGTQLLIKGARAKINDDGTIIDAAVYEQIKELVENLVATILSS